MSTQSFFHQLSIMLEYNGNWHAYKVVSLKFGPKMEKNDKKWLVIIFALYLNQPIISWCKMGKYIHQDVDFSQSLPYNIVVRSLKEQN